MAPVYCIPAAAQYPALPEPPQWWSPGGSPGFSDRLDDPRWAGNLMIIEPGGASGGFNFRMLKHTSGGVTYLYLSFHVKTDPDPDITPNNSVQVGLRTGTGAFSAANPAYVIKITLSNALTGAGTVKAGGTTYYATPDVIRNSGSGWVTETSWAWITQYTRVWAANIGTADATWAVNMVIPVQAAPSGIPLSNTFGLCVYTQVFNTIMGGAPFKWPSTLASPTTSGGIINPASGDFQRCAIGAPAAGDSCFLGITLPVGNIGTTNVIDPATGTQNPSKIKFTAGTTTQFFVRPVNNDPTLTVPAGTLSAEIRLANWGSAAATDPAPWSPLSGPPVMTNHAEIGPFGGGNNAQSILLDWTVSASESTFYSAHRHQCMLALLSSSDASIKLINSAVARNMDFVPASRFSRTAEISAQGLPDLPLAERDMYIFVEAKNMPAKLDDETRERYAKARELLPLFYPPAEDELSDYTHYLDYSRRYQVTLEEFEQLMPTCIYHVYHDTGERMEWNGELYPVLEAQPSFGYHVWHEGSFIGWDLRLRGAIKLSDSIYLVRPPMGGTALVETVIHAVEEGEKLEPEEKVYQRPSYEWVERPDRPRKPPRSTPDSGPRGCLDLVVELIRILARALAEVLRRL